MFSSVIIRILLHYAKKARLLAWPVLGTSGIEPAEDKANADSLRRSLSPKR
jgi:hypothetical protein